MELVAGIGQAGDLTRNRRNLLKTGHVRWHGVKWHCRRVKHCQYPRGWSRLLTVLNDIAVIDKL